MEGAAEAASGERQRLLGDSADECSDAAPLPHSLPTPGAEAASARHYSEAAGRGASVSRGLLLVSLCVNALLAVAVLLLTAVDWSVRPQAQAQAGASGPAVAQQPPLPPPLFPPLCAARSGPRVLIASSDTRVRTRWRSFPAGAQHVSQLSFTYWSTLSHRLFAMRHGYDYFSADGSVRPTTEQVRSQFGVNASLRTDRPRAPQWAKFYLARRLLPLYDLLLLLDTDTVFTQPERGLQDFLAQHAPHFLQDPQQAMLVSHDLYAEKKGDLANSGVSLIKNSALARAMLEHLWTSVDHPYNLSTPLPQEPERLRLHCEAVRRRERIDYRTYKWHWSYDQRVLNSFVLCDPRFGSSVTVLPYDVLSVRNGSYIAHLFGLYSKKSRDEVTAQAAMDALMKLTLVEQFQDADLQSRTLAAFSQAFPDELRRQTDTEVEAAATHDADGGL